MFYDFIGPTEFYAETFENCQFETKKLFVSPENIDYVPTKK